MKTLLATAALFLLSSCSCGQTTMPPPAEVWAKTTTPFDATCAKCTQIGDGALSHIGEGGKVYIDKTTDDPPAQWGKCIMAFMKCVDADGEIPTCVETAPCPAACKAEFKSKLGAATEFEDQAKAMDATFFDDGALCAPKEEAP
jgi:hypothetical protein